MNTFWKPIVWSGPKHLKYNTIPQSNIQVREQQVCIVLCSSFMHRLTPRSHCVDVLYYSWPQILFTLITLIAYWIHFHSCIVVAVICAASTGVLWLTVSCCAASTGVLWLAVSCCAASTGVLWLAVSCCAASTGVLWLAVSCCAASTGVLWLAVSCVEVVVLCTD